MGCDGWDRAGVVSHYRDGNGISHAKVLPVSPCQYFPFRFCEPCPQRVLFSG